MSSLQRQLAQIANRSGTKQNVRRARIPSLLFDAKKAEHIDVETIWGLGLNGFMELRKKDHRLEEFEESVFAKACLHWNRELETQVQSNNAQYRRSGMIN